MLVTKMIKLANTIIPVVNLLEWIAYLGLIIRLWLVTGFLSIYN